MFSIRSISSFNVLNLFVVKCLPDYACAIVMHNIDRVFLRYNPANNVNYYYIFIIWNIGIFFTRYTLWLLKACVIFSVDPEPRITRIVYMLWFHFDRIIMGMKVITISILGYSSHFTQKYTLHSAWQLCYGNDGAPDTFLPLYYYCWRFSCHYSSLSICHHP